MSRLIEKAEVVFVDGADVPVGHKHADRMVLLRDAADPDGDTLYYTVNEWQAFILGVKDGEFDDMATEPDASVTAETPTQGPGGFPWTGRQAPA